MLTHMARGQHSLQHLDFSQKNLFGETETVNTTEERKGRSPILLHSRNHKLLARYYYHNAIKGKVYVVAVEILINEFDIDDRTIALILKKEEATITEMRKKKPPVSSFKKQWPYFNW